MSTTLYYHGMIVYLEKGVWPESLWIKGIIFVPFFALLVYSGIVRLKRG